MSVIGRSSTKGGCAAYSKVSVVVFGTVEDLMALRGIIGKHNYREVLEHASPNIFDFSGPLILVSSMSPRGLSTSGAEFNDTVEKLMVGPKKVSLSIPGRPAPK